MRKCHDDGPNGETSDRCTAHACEVSLINEASARIRYVCVNKKVLGVVSYKFLKSGDSSC